MQLKEYDAALADLQEVTRIDPKLRPNTLNGIVEVYKAQGQWQRVVEIYTEKMDQDKQFSKFAQAQNLAGRGAAHEALEQWELAKTDYTTALQLNPRNRDAATGLKRMSERE